MNRPFTKIRVLGNTLLALVTLAWSAAFGGMATAAQIGLTGGQFEAYTDYNQCASFCTVSFPVNNTGKVIKIQNINCRASTTGTVYATFGPSATDAGGLLKSSNFEILISAGTANNYILASQTGMLLGAGRYLSVYAQTTQGAAVGLQCSAFGVVAQ